MKPYNKDTMGHACPVWYAALAEKGYFCMEHLDTLRKMMTAGSLGNGLSAGLGMTLSGMRLGKDYRVFVEAASNLAKKGINVRVVEIHTLKPIDSEAIIKAAKETGGIITVEDQNVIGGFGSAVAEVLSETYPVLLKRVALQDKFGESGKSEKLYDYYGMNTHDIIRAAKELRKKM